MARGFERTNIALIPAIRKTLGSASRDGRKRVLVTDLKTLTASYANYP